MDRNVQRGTDASSSGNTSFGNAGRAIAVAVALLIPAVSASAQIQWRSVQEQPAPRMSSAESADQLAHLLGDHARQRIIVQLDRPIDQPTRNRLEDAGVHLHSPLGADAFFATIEAKTLNPRAAGAVDALHAVRRIELGHKLHPILADGRVPQWAVVDAAREGDPDIGAYLLLHRDVHMPDAVADLRQLGVVVRDRLHTVNGLVVELAMSQIDAAASLDRVQWIEPALPKMTELNNSNRSATQADTVQSPPYNLDGSGVEVMVYDGGTALSSHSDFGGRLSTHDGSGLSNHATHVSGTIGGDGSGNASYTGMAPGVTIRSYGFEFSGGGIFLYSNPGDIEADYGGAISGFGVVLANNSIGTNTATNGFDCAITGDYGVTATVIDSVVRGSLGSPMRIVWANGNERQTSRCGDLYNTTAPPAGAKNHITVGAMNSNDNSVTSFTSWRPADVGRITPHFSAPGCLSNDDGGVTSTSSSGGYTTLCGTSMASPTATGAAALIIEDYRAQFPTRPEMLPSTLKTLLVHNALDLENPGPDYMTGYGLIQVQDTIDFMRTGNFIEQEISQGQTLEFIVNVDSNADELRATLAWDDPPGTPNVNPALVNNLDLQVSGPGGTFDPWVLNPANPASNATRGVDSVNNVEQVTIDFPSAGQWTVSVTAANVPEGPQPFSLAIAPNLVGTSITLVDGAVELVEPAVPTDVQVRIIATGESVVPGSAQLHYRVDGGAFTTEPMTPLGGQLYEATLPGVLCDELLEYYFSAEGSTTGLVSTPSGAPAETFSPEVGVIDVLFADNFETDTGWTTVDNAVEGAWERGVPVGNGRGDPPSDADGSGQCYLTENDPFDDNSDVDDGDVTLTSPTMDASAGNTMLAYWRWFSNDSGDGPNTDAFTVEISDDNGASWQTLEVVGPSGPGTSGGWIRAEFNLDDVSGFTPNDQFRIRFTAEDVDPQSVVEAAVDGLELSSFQCESPVDPCPADIAEGDDQVNVFDLLELLAGWGGAGPGADLAEPSNVIDVFDLLELLAAWGPCPG